MTVIGRFENGAVLTRETVAGPASYATGAPPTITLNDLSQADAVLSLFIDDGRYAQLVSLVGRVVTFRVRGADVPIAAAAGDIGDEPADTTDLSGSNITVTAVGR